MIWHKHKRNARTVRVLGCRRRRRLPHPFNVCACVFLARITRSLCAELQFSLTKHDIWIGIGWYGGKTCEATTPAAFETGKMKGENHFHPKIVFGAINLLNAGRERERKKK